MALCHGYLHRQVPILQAFMLESSMKPSRTMLLLAMNTSSIIGRHADHYVMNEQHQLGCD
jgi:hypothetical protein